MKRFFLFISVAFALTNTWASPLPADQAFAFSATAKNYQMALLQWKIAPNYYLYKNKFVFHVIKPADGQLGDPLYPNNTQTLKTSLGDFDVYAHSLIIPIPIIQSDQKNLVLQVKYQGCSKAGYCYPPATKIVSIDLAGNYMQPVSALNIDVAPEIKVIHQSNLPQTLAKIINKHSLFLMITSFFGFGILLSLTPCVLPMIPILSSIIIGQKNKSHLHTFLLSLFYVFGMAITYAAIGVLFGILGSNIQIIFQQPWIIVCFSLLFFMMALSLFGLFTIQLPEKLRGFIAEKSHHQKSGTYFGAAIMGCLSTLILSPCVTPPLVAALGLISQSGNPTIGGIVLFAMGIGMGLPLLLIGAVGQKILPKPGRWMNAIKYGLGVLLLLVAAMMMQRVLPTLSDQSPSDFQSVHSVAEIESALQAAGNKPVMLDFSADWCVACKEFNTFTFKNPAVEEKLKHFMLLRADVTKNSLEDQMLEQHYGVVAPPTILFFYNGQEITNSRVIGYFPAKKFISHLDQNVDNVSTSASN